MYRSKTCGELRLQDAGSVVTLAGWVQRSRKMGGMTFVDLRDRYGLTQLVFNEADDAELCDRANKLGREFCIQIKGEVSERQSKNPKMPTGDIEILVKELNVLSESLTPPFTIEDNTDGGDDIRMKYRYLDLRRAAVRKNLELRHRMTILIRNFLDGKDFIEVETPILIGSTTCVPTASQSSLRLTARCRLSIRRMFSSSSRIWLATCLRRFVVLSFLHSSV